MKLTKVRITEFQSIQDSTEFKIGDVTCLVGKNEAGKTALLKALYRLNPIIRSDGNFDVTDDYPRQNVTDYQDAITAKRREPAEVVQATYELEKDDVTAIEDVFGPKCLNDGISTVSLHKGYSNKRTLSSLSMNSELALKHLVEAAGLPQPLASELLAQKTVEEKADTLASAEQTEAVQRLTPMFRKIADSNLSSVIYREIIQPRIPKFLYFDEYYQMKGQDNLDILKDRVANDALEESDHPLLGLIELARLDLDQLTDPGRTETLIARLEAAENQLTQKVLTYWSQNQHLRMKFDIRQAQPEDPEGMTSGTNIWGRIHDTKHMVSTPLRTRSRGFLWFFSFLAWYSHQKEENLILLLDEPGLSLHAKAQADLLRYFEKELKPHHQLIYTTHSPFMIDSTHFDRVRIVQDLSIEQNSENLSEDQKGTKVTTEVLDATPDSLFPLQGALGYEIYQTLFIGPNSLVVEGVSDLLYIQTMSALLQANGSAGLSADWTITPVGGADKVPAFVALIGAQKDLNVAVLIDYQKRDQQRVENLYKKRLLQKTHLFTYATFVSRHEADIEDMFDPNFYLKLLNGAFNSSVVLTDLPKNPPRILSRLKQYLDTNPLPGNANFNHYRPARYFTDNITSLAEQPSQQELDRFQQLFDELNGLLAPV